MSFNGSDGSVFLSDEGSCAGYSHSIKLKLRPVSCKPQAEGQPDPRSAAGGAALLCPKSLSGSIPRFRALERTAS